LTGNTIGAFVGLIPSDTLGKPLVQGSITKTGGTIVILASVAGCTSSVGGRVLRVEVRPGRLC
jgi:hypothetical protein